MKQIHILFVLSLFLFTACGGSTESTSKEESQEKVLLAPEVEEEERPIDIPESVEIVIEGNDQMRYNLTTIEVYEGQTVKLTLKHTGEMPKETMGHNWTLLSSGVELEEFAIAAITAVDNDYIPADRMSDIIANTTLIGGGEETSIEFTAPAKGNYKFLCTFPGHFGMMNGDFIVK